MEISVIIPAYNRAHLIGETLRSLLRQTRPADEIIVVDDGSTDNTAEVAAQFGGPVKVIRQANAGPAAARNAGFRASQGEFIHFFDSDDLAAASKQEAQLARLETTGADIAMSPWVQGSFRQNQFAASNQVLQQHGLPADNNLVRALLSDWSIVPHAALFRRSIVERSGGFPEDFFGTEDQLMFVSCLLLGARVTHSPGTILFYRLGEAGKITENKGWSVRRLTDWARFLVKAREACLEKKMEPLAWSGFRVRLWKVERDLREVGHADEVLLSTLQSLVASGPVGFFDHWEGKMERWRQGLQQRLTGARAHRSFRTGKMTDEQIKMLAQLGYGYEPPRSLPWWPQGAPN